MEMEEKEKAKAFFSFTQVPFCVVVDQSGTIISVGDPKGMDFQKLFVSVSTISENILNNAKSSAAESVTQPAFVLDEDF